MSSLLEQWRNEDAAGGQGNGVRMALEASGDLTAQKAARAIQLSKVLGLPENFVAQKPVWRGTGAHCPATGEVSYPGGLYGGGSPESRVAA